MRKFFLVLAAVYVAFLVEQIAGRYFGRWLTPDLLLLVVIFFNLSRGTRYSLLAAVMAGLLKDSFLPRGFGIYLFAFICDAYLTSSLKVYIYQSGSSMSRVLLAALMVLIHNHILFFLTLMSVSVHYFEMAHYILLPAIVVTTLVTNFTFEKFKQCVLRYFV